MPNIETSTNDKGNPYHDTATGKFASKDGAGGGKVVVGSRWFLRSKKIIGDWKGASMTVGQLKSALSQVSEDERKWTGLQEFLDKHTDPNEKILKQDVLAHIQEPTLHETVYGRRLDLPSVDGVSAKKLVEDSGFADVLADVRKKHSAAKDNWKHGIYHDAYHYNERLAENTVSYKDTHIKLETFYYQAGKVKVDVFVANTRGLGYYQHVDTLKVANATKVVQAVHDILSDKYPEDFDLEKHPTARSQYGEYTLDGGKDYSEMLISVDSDLSKKVLNTDRTFQISHFSNTGGVRPPNVVAHVRHKTRTIGGSKTLFIEEIQSDVHEAARKKDPHDPSKKVGYAEDSDLQRRAQLQLEFNKQLNKVDAAIRTVDRGSGDQRVFANLGYAYSKNGHSHNRPISVRISETGAEVDIREDGSLRYHSGSGYDTSALDEEAANALINKYPSLEGYRNLAPMLKDLNTAYHALETDKDVNKPIKLPFSKTWDKLILRRMVRYAAEHGFKQIGWTDGKTQSKRFGLSTIAEQIDVLPDGDNGVKLNMYRNGVVDKVQYVKRENLADYVGKDAAKKYTGSKITLKDDDMDVGTEGMKSFYDGDIPDAAKEIGKPFGTEPRKINYTTPAGKKVNVWVMEITPEMRKSVLEQGFPLFKSLAVIRMMK